MPNSLSHPEELAILNRIASALNSSLNLDDTLQSTLELVAQLLGLETAWVWLLEPNENQHYLAAAQKLPPGLAEHPAKMEGGCYCLDTFREGDLDGAANVNVVRCSRLRWLKDGTRGLLYHASIPLYAHGRKMGVLNVASQDWRGLDEHELRMLYTIGDLLGIAVERAQLFEQSLRLGAAEERNRLAREIHDTLAQELAGLTLQLESADALIDANADSERVQVIVQQALQMARTSLEDVQRSVLDLRAAPLEGRALAEALAELIANVNAENDLNVSFDVVNAPQPLPARIEAGVYRIAQESLRNVIQHAAATRAEVELTVQPSYLRLVVADNGCGFDPAEVQQARFGLIGLNERAKLLGGRMLLESSLDQGTRIEVTLPLT